MIKVVLPLILFTLLTGCVHDVSVAPEISKIKKTRPVTINRTVAYYIPDELYKLSVKTPGGNNDKIRYSPYSETEPALNKVLNNVFTEVYKVDSLDDKLIAEKKIKFIFIPSIETMSLSNSNVDWQPTRFNMILKVKVFRSNKEVLFTSYAQGKGIANFGRYMKNPSYAPEVASRSAFVQFQNEVITKRKRFK